MRRSTKGRTRPGALGRVLRAGVLAAAALAMPVFFAGPALADGPGPMPLPLGGGKPSPCTPSCSPVIVDVDGSGYRLTDAAHGVLFDFAGRGHLVRAAWTAPGSTDAFLVLPRDGRVDNGSELFGNLTPQPPSAQPNGFAALAVWDQPGRGGNGDGVIDKADAVWPRLRLWQDTNHDGKVQPGELHPLSAFGITGISLRYHAVGGTDRFGNRYGYAAAVFRSGRAAAVAYDFFLATAPAGPASPPANSRPGVAGAGVGALAGVVVLAGAALAAGRRRRARHRAQALVRAGQVEPDRDIPVSIGR